MDRQEYGSIEVSRTSKVSIPADGENVRQQFSLKAPVEEKNLLALHNLTEKNLLGRQHTPNFNPRPREGGRRHGRTARMSSSYHFNPRPREGGDCTSNGILIDRLISIHTPREGATYGKHECTQQHPISIHAPREGGDITSTSTFWSPSYFNPRPPRGGRPGMLFTGLPFVYFNPRPPRGGRRLALYWSADCTSISIHAPREGGDPRDRYAAASLWYFNPRPPRGGRRAGRKRTSGENLEFQSTPPARGATSSIQYEYKGSLFQSTPPARGATDDRHHDGGISHISIHAPREGGDRCGLCGHVVRVEFQSTPPARGATSKAILRR